MVYLKMTEGDYKELLADDDVECDEDMLDDEDDDLITFEQVKKRITQGLVKEDEIERWNLNTDQLMDLFKLTAHESVDLAKSMVPDRSATKKKREKMLEISYNLLYIQKVMQRNSLFNHPSHVLKPESWKTLVAMSYFFLVTLLTAFIMVFVHDRVPDMRTYPPLPDIFLDNVPLIPWAFKMCELCGIALLTIWCVILIFHKYRFILLRRMFSLFGSVFLLRCVTMLITSLSVPGKHLNCKARPYGNWTEKVHQAYLIWSGGGMSLKGVRTCGDYMFSGHTVTLTLLNFFITEYTHPQLYYLHTLSWVINLFGVFFILAAHEHYSIDVFVAFYISTRLFLYYHTLANNRALYQKDRKRTRIWFPLFSFFESGVNGIVPNKFEQPFKLEPIRHWIDRLMSKKEE